MAGAIPGVRAAGATAAIGSMRLAAYTDSQTFGGAEQSLGHLLEGLHPDIDVALLGVDPAVLATLARRRPGTRVRRLPRVRGKADVRSIGAHLRVLGSLRPDVLHVSLHEPLAARYAIAAAALLPYVRVVAVEQLPTPLEGRSRRWLKAWISRRVDAHVAVGQRSSRLVEQYAGLPAGSVRTIYNGVPDHAERAPLRRNRTQLVLGSLGRFDTQKGYDVLLRALSDVPGATFTLVGDGPERPALERAVRELGLEDRVRLPGWSDDARRVLPGFDVFVLPSRFEAFPLAIVEAMLTGLPIVATPVGSVPEAIIDGETGLLVAPDDAAGLAAALRRLAASPDLRARLGEAARKRALERFTARTMVDAYEALYRELLR